MKNLCFSVAALLVSMTATSQSSFLNNGNGNGNGNITNVQANLHVGANMKVDSALVVTDSALFESSLRTEGSLRVEEEAYFMNKVFMNFLTAATGIDDPGMELILKSSDEGELKTITLTEFISLAVDKQNFDDCIAGYSDAPYWMQKPEVLYTVCSNVFCGLGTSNPLHKLHVVGTSFGLKLLAGNPDAPADAAINGFAQGTTTPLLILGQKTGALSHSVRFTINNDGNIVMNNVGSQPTLLINNGSGHAIVINDNSGNKILQLDASGLFHSRYIKVDNASWADYVFADNYVLMPLAEVEKYIHKEGHLPNIPSAKEIEEDGLNLGEMQSLQMEKIEEMYLHMIEMEKKINSLTNEVNVLKSENNQLKNK